MEEAWEASPTGEGPGPTIVLEKHRALSSSPAAHVQLACSPRHCAFPLDGSRLCVWSTRDPSEQLLMLRGHHQSITAVAFGNTEVPLLVCSASQDYVILWNLDDCREKVAQGLTPRGTEMGTRPGKVQSLRFSPDDRMVAVCAGSRVLLLDVAGRGLLAQLQGHRGSVTAAEFCPWQADTVISVSEDRSFKVGSCVHQHGSQALAVSGPPSPSQLLSSCPQLPVSRWRAWPEPQPWRCRVRAKGNVSVTGLGQPCGLLAALFPRAVSLPAAESAGGRGAQAGGHGGRRWPEGPYGDGKVDTAVPVLSLAPCDLSGVLGPACAPLTAGAVWVGSSEGLLLLLPASCELEAILLFQDFQNLSVQVAGSCALSSGGCQTFCLLSSLFGGQIVLLEVFVDALLRVQPSPGLGRGLSVLASSCVPPTSLLYLGAAGKREAEPDTPKLPSLRGAVKDQPLVFHHQVRSSGYAEAPRATMFSPKTNVKDAGKRPSRVKNSRRCDRDPWERPLPTSLWKWRSSTLGRTAVNCVQFSGDGRRLACGLSDHLSLVLDAELTGTPAVLSGHGGAVSAVSWSHNGRWLLTAAQDSTLKLWVARRAELALTLGAGLISGPVPAAQFYYMDAFILLAAGPEVQLLSFHLDTSKDEIRRYKRRSWGRPVLRLALTGGAEVTSLSAVNDFYSHVLLTAGRNRALEVFDLSTGHSTALVAEAHSRPVHHISQNTGSAFTSQTPHSYNLFATAALGDGVRLWDLRTLRCERRFEGHQARSIPCGLAFSPCGRYVACGSEDRHAYVYDVASGTFSHRLAGHTDTVSAVAFRPSAPQVVTQVLPLCPRRHLVGRDSVRGDWPAGRAGPGWMTRRGQGCPRGWLSRGQGAGVCSERTAAGQGAGVPP
ncbi:WD repeat-containing protein 27 isoform X2 [Erinaceus europaeus]|uniref:WD repeat-containing protein 27 isoform X2 n=1 Tax=Erinaceus europaeus TaxID=9365 RepID=A0ABM3YJC5_ERIEU|nr:WD repeat-containing protein 27 isoform X2 [Erinaceus europaeus]